MPEVQKELIKLDLLLKIASCSMHVVIRIAAGFIDGDKHLLLGGVGQNREALTSAIQAECESWIIPRVGQVKTWKGKLKPSCFEFKQPHMNLIELKRELIAIIL